MWVAILQFVVTLLLGQLMTSYPLFIPIINILLAIYYIVPFCITIVAANGDITLHGMNPMVFMTTAFLQILLVSYLVCRFRLADKLRSWFKKRREDRIGE